LLVGRLLKKGKAAGTNRDSLDVLAGWLMLARPFAIIAAAKSIAGGDEKDDVAHRGRLCGKLKLTVSDKRTTNKVLYSTATSGKKY